MARALMLQGTGSDVGKSLLLAGLARAFTRQGLRVRPFKPQNMSNTAAVAADGGEIGRAQALQARACGTAAVTDMNPVLLKPQSESGAQIVLHGRVWRAASAGEYRRLAPSLMPAIFGSFSRLVEAADLVLVEGAGSPAEINLRDGDIGLFDGGIDVITGRTGTPCFGVVPYFAGAASLPAEDSLALAPHPSPLPASGEREGPAQREGERPLRIAVPMLPRIANFDDLDPLRAEPGAEVIMVRPGQPLPRDAALVILPGSKATISDLEFLQREGWDIDLLAHRRQGGRILGLCGGYQMLGRRISDALGVEGRKQTVPGLGLLDIETVLTDTKRLAESCGVDLATGMPVRGYEIHVGETAGPGLKRPMLRLAGGRDGCVSADGLVAGCYLHGLFTSDPFRREYLARLGAEPGGLAYEHNIETTLDALADHLARSLDLSALLAAARLPRLRRAA